MNFITRKLLLILLVSTSAGHTSNAMDLPVMCKNMNKQELILNIKELPRELRVYIVSLLIQRSIVDFQLYKTFYLENCPLALSPEGEHILFEGCSYDLQVSFGGASQAVLWNIEIEKEERRFVGHQGKLCSLAFSPDRETIITGSTDSTARLWNFKTGTLIKTLFTGRDVPLLSVAFSSKGETCFTGATDGTVCMWDSKTGNRLATLVENRVKTLTQAGLTKGIEQLIYDFSGFSNIIHLLVFSPVGETCLLVPGYENDYDGKIMKFTTAYVVNIETGTLLTTFTSPGGDICSAAFSPEGEVCLTGATDATACLWNSKTGKLLTTLQAHTDSISSVAFSPKGEVCLTGSADNTVGVWSSKTGKLLTILKGPADSIYSLAVSLNGERCVALSRDKEVSVWKREYNGFTALEGERKEIAFKLFFSLYPLVQKLYDETDASEIKAASSRGLERGVGLDIHTGHQNNCTIS